MSCGYVTPEDVRHYVRDACLQDNPDLGDLTFSDEQIHVAMRHAAREFNSIPPMVCRAEPSQLPADTNMFFDGIAKHLLVSWRHTLGRQDIDYAAGSVGANLVAKQIVHIDTMVKFHDAQFKQAAQDFKLHINIHRAFRAF